MDLLVDSGNRVAESYGIAFNIQKDLQAAYKQSGIDISEYNDDASWKLPMPARYIIDQNQRIRYSEINADYTIRPEPSETIEVLKKMIKE